MRIEPDSGDNITGIEVVEDKIIVFKEKSVWQVTINSVQIGNFFLIEPVYDLINGSVGCASHKTISRVENDIFFLAKGGRGVFIVGREPNIASDILRTNEVSVKVRPYFQNVTAAQEMNACAVYFQNKYILAFPGRNESLAFDRERKAWLGPWTFDGNVFEVYYDSNDAAHLLIGEDESTNVDDISASYPGDKGVAMTTILRTKKESFNDWTTFKTIKNVFTRWRNVLGSVAVDIRLEKRSGNTVTAKNFTLTPGSGNSGWGADMWGSLLWGSTNPDGLANDVSEIVRWNIVQQAARHIQFQIRTSNLNDNYELLGIKTEAQEIGGSFRPSSWKV